MARIRKRVQRERGRLEGPCFHSWPEGVGRSGSREGYRTAVGQGDAGGAASGEGARTAWPPRFSGSVNLDAVRALVYLWGHARGSEQSERAHRRTSQTLGWSVTACIKSMDPARCNHMLNHILR